MNDDVRPLAGQVAVVAGATRGCGRGIAIELGAAGATVYCTGRSSRGGPKGLTYRNRPDTETIEETAEMVTAEGGIGIPVPVNHLEEAEVRALFERIEREQNGRMDILINDIWGGEQTPTWGIPFWELDMAQGWTMVERAVRTHILTNRYGAPLMIRRNRGLIVEVTDGDTLNYRGSLFYDLAKVSVIRLAVAMAAEFADQKRSITALAITPGFLRSEMMLDHFGVSEENWRDAIAKDADYARSETPRYLGRAIAALAADRQVHTKAGKALSTWKLVKEYGFTDVDGRQPIWSEE